MPAAKENAAPSIKLHSSPTPAVVVPLMRIWSRFFIRLMTMPYTGPSAKAPSRAGRSEKSIFTKGGISIGMGNSMNMSTNATAESMAATTARRVLPACRRVWTVGVFWVFSACGSISMQLRAEYR